MDQETNETREYPENFPPPIKKEETKKKSNKPKYVDIE